MTKRKANGDAETSDPPVGQWPADRRTRVKVETLLPYARNARLHTNAQIEAIAQAIKRFGFTVPVIVDHRGEIIAGHGRVMAARRLGRKTIPTIVIAEGEWDEDTKRAYRIWDNQSALLSDWSPEMLRVELQHLKTAGFPLKVTGFDPGALVTFMANPNPQAPGEFQRFGEDIATEFCCPKCSYRWSGSPTAGATQPDQKKAKRK